MVLYIVQTLGSTPWYYAVRYVQIALGFLHAWIPEIVYQKVCVFVYLYVCLYINKSL